MITRYAVKKEAGLISFVAKKSGSSYECVYLRKEYMLRYASSAAKEYAAYATSLLLGKDGSGLRCKKKKKKKKQRRWIDSLPTSLPASIPGEDLFSDSLFVFLVL